ncbi:Predicted member of the intramitochondrial sorting protein family [Ceraceosorus bombacis]|uniref:Predicted member of the intramitochondrial sorting protein family n=1 Tax=Ceraceosorus bombacis TaxID=401625 RepID=A0A0P1BJ27_9BASI|nr:Predicted member of the intramitochondrial sorting protein family [Ceraceosorus bombacis]
MPQAYEGHYDLPHSWARTALGVLHKYPNTHATHVVSLDVIDQQLQLDQRPNGNAGLLVRLERILGVRQGAPAWAVKLLGGDEETYVREVVMVDTAGQIVEMTSTNMSLSRYLLVKEYITYTPTSAQNRSTTFHQRARILAGGLPLSAMARKVEDWSKDRFASNAGKGEAGIAEVLKGLWDAGVSDGLASRSLHEK